ncbi:MAG TPA: extensin family protein [Sphingopyxis sp.]|uniref:extensin-like domain-containing protein n=1 Tax=Sphingopyxis sp. TaxID=1908224 RepID=UPI002BAA1AF7|nr:extensin family protein [Sphingopyxis sp.]HWW57480.1 extensin family protein [Sphingopyxis sp.]
MMKSLRPYLVWFAVAVLLAIGAILGMQWVRAHPEHIPGVRFELAHPRGWATHGKLVALASDDTACFAAFDRAEAGYLRRPAVGNDVCRASQRMILTGNRFAPTMRPANAAPGCAVTAAMIVWNRDVVQPLAEKHFGQKVVELENLGSYNCRKIAGGQAQSEHSTANAIDISAFILADGTRITLINDWKPGDRRSEFLHEVRDGSCGLFSTVLSPDHNAAHANHFHFDMAARTAGWTVCR